MSAVEKTTPWEELDSMHEKLQALRDERTARNARHLEQLTELYSEIHQMELRRRSQEELMTSALYRNQHYAHLLDVAYGDLRKCRDAHVRRSEHIAVLNDSLVERDVDNYVLSDELTARDDTIASLKEQLRMQAPGWRHADADGEVPA